MPVLSWWTSRPEPTDRPRRCTSTSSGGTRSQGRRWGLEPVRIAVHDLDTNGGTRQPVPLGERTRGAFREDRKSTRLNSSHVKISYAVFCLKKKKKHR